ncbi:MAG TPA: hypothetical protein VMU21_04760 [Thermodesulfovibrionales bacterium]|nr:hypothetical protein [Thermodesulfovibrionales bacterium]
MSIKNHFLKTSESQPIPLPDDSPNHAFQETPMATIAEALLTLATSRVICSELPGIYTHVRNLREAMGRADSLTQETLLVNLYASLHTAGSLYSPSERVLLSKRAGYSCHAGGLSPLIRAEPFITPDSVVVDLGAGNGLQGLLLQCLSPHRRTLQVELSSEMIRIGRLFQEALGISADRVEWIHDDLVNVSVEAADIVYLYRPARTSPDGRELYRTIARKLASVPKPLMVFSVADCLGQFLNEQFSLFFTDGHLTCFSKR